MNIPKTRRPLALRARNAQTEPERQAVRVEALKRLLRWTASNLLLMPIWGMLSALPYEGNEWLIGAWGLLTGAVWACILANLLLWIKLRPRGAPR